MPLTITAVDGRVVVLNSRGVLNPVLREGPTRQAGLQDAEVLTFDFEGYIRRRLPEIAALAGTKVVQQPNRAGVIQLTSETPCSFVRFVWTRATPMSPFYSGFDDYGTAKTQGVFTASSEVNGPLERLTLTLYRGDWLRKLDGTIERFV